VEDLCYEISDKYTSPEDVTFRRVVDSLDQESVFSVIEDLFEVDKFELLLQRRDYPLRGIAAMLLMRYSGLTQRQVAALLKVRSGSTISKQIARSRKLLAEEEELRCLVRKCEQVLKRVSGSCLDTGHLIHGFNKGVSGAVNRYFTQASSSRRFFPIASAKVSNVERRISSA
jgi:hypothetical protein